MCFKCQKYGHHREACRGRHTCTKCGEKDPDHVEEDCLKETRCANCRQNPATNARSCKAYKKEKETREVRHKRSSSFLKARKIVGTYMGENSYYTSVARRADTINQDNRYRALVEKFIQLKPSDWLKFQEQLKNLDSAELQTQPRSASANKEKASETTKLKSPTNKQTLLFKPKVLPCPQKRKSLPKLNSHRSPVQPPSSKLNNPNLELNCDKHNASHNIKWIMPHHQLDANDWKCRLSQMKPQTLKTDWTH